MTQRSPRKPRILWRGELHLQDGTALPGLAIVSTSEPLFASQSPSRGGQQTSERHDVLDSIFTLSKESQDDLSLAIEMVRHAPLRIVDVRGDLSLDGQGRLTLPTVDSAKEGGGGGLSNTRSSVPHLPGFSITYEAAGDVRLYVDPAEHSTVAFFERTFAYEAYGARFIGDVQREAELKQDAGSSMARSALTFSFEKISPFDGTDAQDVFSSAYALWSSSDHASRRLYGDGAMEAAVVGVVRKTTEGAFDCVELHVGRKITRRTLAAAAATGRTSTKVTSAISRSQSTTAVRPDDPAPRFASKFALSPPKKLPFASSKSTPTIRHTSSTRPADKACLVPSSSTAKRRSEEMSQPYKDSAVTNAVEATKRRGGAHTPGRRGEKRSRKSTSEAIHLDADTSIHPSSPKPVAVKTESSSTTTTSAPAAHVREANVGLEDQNRSLIKKLVHYQLLGKGVERHEDTYAACFGPTCQGALLAFRKVAKLELIDKQSAASIVERHLDMYL